MSNVSSDETNVFKEQRTTPPDILTKEAYDWRLFIFSSIVFREIKYNWDVTEMEARTPPAGTSYMIYRN
jgi:hypothetical protein